MSDLHRQRCLEKARRLQDRTAKWLDKETACLPDQKATLQTLLAALRERLELQA